MIVIDGRHGEGGGQILRTSLALSVVTGQPFRITDIRGKRKKPGLLRQHLTAAKAAAEISTGSLEGAEIKSSELSLTPREVKSGNYKFAIGTAGSTTLVLQTILPALLTASGESEITLEGGTHNHFAPPYDFLQKTFMPLISKMGPKVKMQLSRYGFYPAGGGRFTVSIAPTKELKPFDLLERGDICSTKARVLISGLPTSIAERELDVIAKKLGLKREAGEVQVISEKFGPGNIVFIELASTHLTEVIAGFGQHGVKAERVANRAAGSAKRYIASSAPVGEYLADQLLIPLAMASGGAFRTIKPSEHTRTNADVISKFLPVEITMRDEGRDVWLIEIKKS